MKKLFIIFVVSFLLLGCGTERELFVVYGSAMEPTYKDGDYIWVYPMDRDFEEEEIVVYENKNGNIILGRIHEIVDDDYIIWPDNSEEGFNTDEYLPTTFDKIQGTAKPCFNKKWACLLKGIY